MEYEAFWMSKMAVLTSESNVVIKCMCVCVCLSVCLSLHVHKHSINTITQCTCQLCINLSPHFRGYNIISSLRLIKQSHSLWLHHHKWFYNICLSIIIVQFTSPSDPRFGWTPGVWHRQANEYCGASTLSPRHCTLVYSTSGTSIKTQCRP